MMSTHTLKRNQNNIWTVIQQSYFVDGIWKKELQYWKGDITENNGISTDAYPQFRDIPGKREFQWYIGVVETEFPAEFPIMKFIKQNPWWLESLDDPIEI